MIKFVFIVLGWMCFGKFLMEKVVGLDYYKMFDEYLAENNRHIDENVKTAARHVFVQSVLYLIAPPIYVSCLICTVIRKIQ